MVSTSKKPVPLSTGARVLIGISVIVVVVISSVLIGLAVTGNLNKPIHLENSLVNRDACSGVPVNLMQRTVLSSDAGMFITAVRPNPIEDEDDVHIILSRLHARHLPIAVRFRDIEERSADLSTVHGSVENSLVPGMEFDGYSFVSAIEGVAMVVAVRNQNSPTATFLTFERGSAGNSPIFSTGTLLQESAVNLPGNWFVRGMVMVSKLQCVVLASTSKDTNYSVFNITREFGSRVWSAPVQVIPEADSPTSQGWLVLTRLGGKSVHLAISRTNLQGDVTTINVFAVDADSPTFTSIQSMPNPQHPSDLPKWGSGLAVSESGRWLAIPDSVNRTIYLWEWSGIEYASRVQVNPAPGSDSSSWGEWIFVNDAGMLLVSTKNGKVFQTHTTNPNTNWVTPPLDISMEDGFGPDSFTDQFIPPVAWSTSNGTWRTLMNWTSNHESHAIVIEAECVM